ncbi:pyridoxamine 5'-phosphate oxidase family protein [[Mycobacterium] wendilense]|uniref:Pyridoxamine 5'-phosphate oxidase family protein n=1 Tax=[Mycobacterium] wendilense TaxID=3064284 RepID=A0ABN9P5F8_9MYCO|nr:pyridoxamine 5'-phosphate oxidase family protein [Mycolicibacterium sp. MU0050]CAJ1587492.1 pyridoxamine 5'-phosphate oxidase family protein [Mycolicibacterium sp. MU0050]
MSADASPLTAADLDFLDRPLHGFLTTAAGPTPPQPRPVWFEVTDAGTLQLFTAADAAKVTRTRRDPRVSLVVAAPVGEPERWISVAGPATLASDGAIELANRLAARYWDLDDPVRVRDLDAMLTLDHLRLVIHPETVQRSPY